MQIVSGWSAGLASGPGASAGDGGILSTLPDPMKPYLLQIAFVMLLLTILFLYLKAVFFKPMVALVDQRDRDIAAGAESKHRAAAMLEARQAESAARMKELRERTFARRKAFSDAAHREREALILRAKDEATRLREEATGRLQVWRETAKGDLVTQVDALATAMARRLMGQD